MATQLVLRELFGGAMQMAVPCSLQDVSDARPVPDHQEVWADGSTDQSVIVEIVVGVADLIELETHTANWGIAESRTHSTSALFTQERSTVKHPAPNLQLCIAWLMMKHLLYARTHRRQQLLTMPHQPHFTFMTWHNSTAAHLQCCSRSKCLVRQFISQLKEGISGKSRLELQT